MQEKEELIIPWTRESQTFVIAGAVLGGNAESRNTHAEYLFTAKPCKKQSESNRTLKRRINWLLHDFEPCCIHIYTLLLDVHVSHPFGCFYAE